MKLYMHPVSTTSRAVRLFAAEKKISLDEQVVDLFTGEHYKSPYVEMNPSRMVPMLEDGDFRLTESSAILKYLASKHDLPEYPKDLKKRARVDERMDWINTQFSRDYAYGLAYPQLYPHHKRPTDAIHDGTIAWGKERAEGWLAVLDQALIGSNAYIAGDQITIADYLAAAFVSVGDAIRCDFSKYPNVQRWMGAIKKLESWNRINEAFYGFAGSLKEKPFQAI